MAGMTCTITETTVGMVKEVVFEWLSDDAAGTASGTTTEYYDGELLRVVTIPGTGGDQPDDDYDITLSDDAGVDLLFGGGANRDETNTEILYRETPALGCAATTTLALAVSGAGNALQGTVIVWIR